MTATPPGIRFTRIGATTEPCHLLDTWLMVDPTRRADYILRPEPYRSFQVAVDKDFGRSARFVFIGELDPREDLGSGHRLAEILEDIGVDILRPVASNSEVGVSVHTVSRWPGYGVLLHGWVSGSADWARMKVYVLRYS